MAKNDRRADTRSALTGETYQQALTWIRAHGLTAGPVPEAATAEQQILEAAVLRSLARPPLDIDDSLFGIARVTPDTDTLTLWPAPGAAGRVLARVLPAITAGTRTGVPALRAAPESAKYFTLRTDGTARLLVRATRADHNAARDLVAELGGQLLDEEPGADERALWQHQRTDLAAEAPRWSTALRRAGLFLHQWPDWTRRAPAGAETDVPAELTAARPHGPTAPRRVTATIAVTAERGGEGRSTLALALSLELARTGSSVLLLTADRFAHEALQRGGRVTPWSAAPAGAALAPGSVGSAYWDESSDTELVALARRQADIAGPFHDLRGAQLGDAVERTSEAVFGRELDDTAAMDDWWSPAASADLYSRAPEEEQAPLDAWRQDFLRQIDKEGARRHPCLWPRARSEWAQRNRHRNLLELDATDAEAGDLERWTGQFPDAIAPIADEVWGSRWRTVGEAWKSGQAPLLDSLHDFDDQVDVIPVPRTPEETAALLVRRRRPHDGVRVLVVNAAPRDLAPDRVREVSRVLHGNGIEALAAVADSGGMRSLLFDRLAGDRWPPADAESLARMVAAAATAAGSRAE
ncbi:hypothetical protein OG689_44495 [Kitasatospora sp. NBC_00240]|uniref:hypothetical protein n=1 Tax=Kitasatospora sp. NBC_00240 TaxID=2903567 RepID=UPI0022592E6D|nr:hypothetical protein [Kitasatospora sp. NBC_00240]MCX5216199.1 hypothetical protein [Kitasatospora sp. NBC_00240]